MTEAFDKLREPFKPEVIGKLPKITCRECSKAPGKVCDKHNKKDCKHCHNYLTTAHIDLDYVGHGPVTDRLLTVDPNWTWEPMATTPEGAPFIGRGAGGESILWIRLTVCGVTRIGVGSVAAGSFDTEKQLIGDALRNAAMRFGVALDLWAKDGLESGATDEPPIPPEPKETAWQGQIRKAIDALSDPNKAALKAWWPSDLPPVGRLSQTEAAQVLGQIAELIQGKEGPKDTPASDDRGGGTSATAPEPEPAVMT